MSIKIGKNCKIGNLKLAPNYEEIIIGYNVSIGDGVRIDVKHLTIGNRSVIGEGFVIEGRHVDIGTEFHSDKDCRIGGGSCMDKLSSLKIGDLCHMDTYAFINTSRAVVIGDEVGLGYGCRVFTHGAWLNFLEGFPCQWGEVHMGSRIYVATGVTIIPNIKIGNDVVISGDSFVNKDVPSGC